MGMDISAKLIVGLPCDEMVTFLSEEVEDLYKFLEEIGADYASPYYDAPSDEWIVGVEVGTSFSSKSDLSASIQIAYNEAVRIFGGNEKSFNIFCVPHVY